MDLRFTEEQLMIQDVARRIAQEKIAPSAEHHDRTGEFPLENIRLLGENAPGRVYATLGSEQEYFLIDADYYHARPDLVVAGHSAGGNSIVAGHILSTAP